MKKYLTLLLLLSMALVGCSSNESSKKEGYKHELGVTSFKENPRVVSDFYVGELQYLGVDLVGTKVEIASKQLDTKGIVDVGDSMDKMAELKPDLILTINADQYEKLSNIAPTIYLPYGKMNPEKTFEEISKIFNKEDIYKKWQTQFDKRVAEYSEKMNVNDKTFTVGEISNNDIWIYGNNWGRGGFIIYDKFKLKGTDAINKELLSGANNYLNISLENVDKYFGDYVFMTSESVNNKVYNNPIIQETPAIKNKRAILTDAADFYHVDPYSLDYQLDIIGKALTNEK